MIRLSYGTAVKMGLKKGKMLAEPTTAYIMVGDTCESNCSFCAQRRDARKEGFLSRVLWLPYPKDVLRNIKGFSRICFQTLDYPQVVENVLELLKIIPPPIPVSVSIVPIGMEDMRKLKEGGVQIISIALDAANKDIFDRTKGYMVGNRFTWEGHWNALREAKEVFEEVNTHIIVGLGESDEDIYSTFLKLKRMGITVGLFAYTPIFDKVDNAPSLGRYRAIQLTKYLLDRGYVDFLEIENGKIEKLYIPEGEKMDIMRGIPFLTSGCPGCNRPFYNERPGGMIYNYPTLPVEGENRLEELKDYAEIIWI